MKSFWLIFARTCSILVISFSLFLLSCLYNRSGSKDDNNLSGMNLKGKVKSVSETAFSADIKTNEIQNENNLNRQVYLFDKKGKKLQESYYRHDSILSTRIAYKYDGYGCLIEKRSLDNEGNTDSRIIYKYDEKKNLYQKVELDHLSYLVYRETHKYNRNRYEVERFIYRPSQSEWNILYIYDEHGDLKKESFTKIIGGSVMKILYANDKKGNKIEEKYLKKDGSVGSRFTHKYDPKGNITETIMYNSADKIISSTIYTYNKDLRQVETRSPVSDYATEPDQILKYDENGNITEEINNKGFRTSRIVSEYTFDKKGNWIRKKTTEFSLSTREVISVNNIKRAIEYY